MNYGGMFPRMPPRFSNLQTQRYEHKNLGYQYKGKRRRLSLAKEEKNFLKNFQERILARRKLDTKITVANTLSKLGKVYKLLEDCKDNLSDDDIAQQLEESSETVTSVCTDSNMRVVKKLLLNRRRKKKDSTAAERRSAKISALALEIDHWRATMLAEEDKKKQDDALRSEAGNTLQQVLQKQKQTRRLLETVKLLVDLREIRKQQASQRHGTFVEPDVDSRFVRNVDKMKQVIKEKLETFYAEEKTIKVLMEANEADIWGVEKKLRQLEQHPDNVIDYSSVCLEIQYNPRSLVKIRKGWDDYISPLGTPQASRIPSTKLEPPAYPNPTWALYLKAPDTSR